MIIDYFFPCFLEKISAKYCPSMKTDLFSKSSNGLMVREAKKVLNSQDNKKREKDDKFLILFSCFVDN